MDSDEPDIYPLFDEDGELLDPGPDDTPPPASSTDHAGCLAAVALIGLSVASILGSVLLMLEAFE
ncbi:MAG: hypothetical protein HYX69_11340 [Planctomycetia bacterium]|nr:hypothetical protein [Planctomycetia bacterium]